MQLHQASGMIKLPSLHGVGRGHSNAQARLASVPSGRKLSWAHSLNQHLHRHQHRPPDTHCQGSYGLRLCEGASPQPWKILPLAQRHQASQAYVKHRARDRGHGVSPVYLETSIIQVNHNHGESNQAQEKACHSAWRDPGRGPRLDNKPWENRFEK